MVYALVDSGALHNYISLLYVLKSSIVTQSCKDLAVRLATGIKVTSNLLVECSVDFG